MIPRSEIAKYLQSPLRISYEWMKRRKRSQLKRKYQDILDEVGFTFKTRPYLHQFVCFLIGVLEGRFIFNLDMGLGKTKIILDLITFFSKYRGGGSRALIVVPTDVNVEGWMEEIELHSNLTCEPLIGTTEQRRETLLSTDKQVVLCTYPALVHLCCELKEVKNSDARKQTISKKLLKHFLGTFDILGIDEIHYLKNRNTVSFKILDKIAAETPFVFGATGTSFDREPADLWSQFYLVDRGLTFGTTYGFFRTVFYTERSGKWKKYVYDDRLNDVLHEKMQQCSIRYKDTECDDLPAITERRVYVGFSSEAYAYYKPARDSLIKAQYDMDVKKAENHYSQLRQMCSGFVNVDMGDGVKEPVIFSSIPKADALESLLSEVNFDEGKVIIFHEYTLSATIIKRVVEKIGVKYVEVRGETKDKIKEISLFKDKSNDVKVLIANSRSAGVGGNYQKVSNRVIFYESPPGIIRRQCIKRVHRNGQLKPVFITDVLVRGSVEETVLELIKQGKDLFDAIIDKEVDVGSTRVPLFKDV